MQQVNANTDEVNGDGLDRLERNVHAILIDAHKLSRGLKKTFEGISIIFDSLGINNEDLIMLKSSAMSTSSASSASARIADTETADAATSAINAQTTVEVSAGKKLNEAEQSENSGTSGTADAAGIIETLEVSEAEEANSSITYDDLTKIIVEKIKQDTANNKNTVNTVNNKGQDSLPHQLCEHLGIEVSQRLGSEVFRFLRFPEVKSGARQQSQCSN